MDQVVRMHFVFAGRVQGVGFRYSVQQAAIDAGVSGWVKNEPDGTVTCELEGTADAVEQVLLALVEQETHGRAWHRLTIEQRSQLEPLGQNGFYIRR